MESGKKSLADNIKKFSKVPTLEEKLDIAYNIYLETPKLKDPKPSGFLKIILDKNEKLRENAMKFMKFTLNIDDEAKVLELMERRKKMKTFAPDFLPRGPELMGISDAEGKVPYSLGRLAKQYVALEKGDIKRVNDRSRETDKEYRTIFLHHTDRAKHRVILRSGLFYKPKHKVAIDQDQFELCDTSKMTSHEKIGFAAYVINSQGEISIFDHHDMTDRYAHSSMTAGSSVFGAGELKIENGRLKAITVHSGHYKPSMENVYRVLKFFKKEGVDVSNIDIYGVTKIPGLSYKQSSTSKALKYVYKSSEIIAWYDGILKTGRLSKIILNFLKSEDVEEKKLFLIKIFGKHKSDKKLVYEIGKKFFDQAAANNHPDIIKLISDNLKIDAKDKMHAIRIAASEGNLETIKLFMDNESDIELKRQISNISLVYAADYGNLDAVKYLLSMNPKPDVDFKNVDGKTALICTVEKNNYKVFRELMSSEPKPDLSVEDTFGSTVLIYALKNKNFDIAREILSYHPKLNICLEAKDLFGKNAFIYAIESGNFDIFNQLSSMNQEFSHDPNRKTALMYAVESDNVAIIKAVLLSDQKPNVDDMDISGNTAFDYSIGKNKEEIIEILSNARDHCAATI